MNTTTNTRGVSEAMVALRPFANAYRRLRHYGDNPTDETPLYAYAGEGHPLYELLNGEHGERLTVRTLGEAAAALEAALSAQQQETPCSLDEALAVIEAWASQGYTLGGDDAPRFRALADRIAPQQQGQGEAVLDADARIGHMVFRKGVRWSTVIGAAQRQFRYHEEDKARRGMRAADLGGPIPESESDALRAVGAPGWDDADEGMAHIPPHAVKVGDDTYAWRDIAPPAQPAEGGKGVDVEDAERWRYLVRENNNGGRGSFRICWFDDRDNLCTTDGVSIDGKDDQAIVRIVDKARLTTKQAAR